MGIENPHVDEVYRSNNGAGPMTARVLSVENGIVQIERWDEGRTRPVIFTIPVPDLALTEWSRDKNVREIRDLMRRITELEAENAGLRGRIVTLEAAATADQELIDRLTRAAAAPAAPRR